MQKGGSTDERRRKNARTRLDAHTAGRANNSACVGGGTVPTVALQHEPELSEQETEPEPWQRWSCPQRRSCTSGSAALAPNSVGSDQERRPRRMSTKTVSNLLAPAGYPQWLAALTPQCGDRTASLLCLGLSRFQPSNEQPTSLPAFACLPAALPAAPRRLVCPQPALPFSSLCFSLSRAAAAPAARRPACAATRQQARSDRDAASAPRSCAGRGPS